ncbi:MAG TPA: type II toxin-antitoxin system PemK/MazF family toxin [Thermoanaerobaculia bacterium]|nr:type II toxin-antitoxin system PemK/MazF family toxin [Thermoanaerobaculia bacterium]
MRRGEVYWAELEPRSGSLQRGRRPVVVVAHDGFNSISTWRSVVVVPLSTSTVRTGPTAIALTAGAGGLGKASVALCHQVTTLDRMKLTKRVGSLSPTDLDRLSEGLRAALELG